MNARVFHQPAIQNGICTICQEESSLLTEAEKSATECLGVARSTNEVDTIDGSCPLA